MFLTPEQLQKLTGYRRPKEQKTALAAMGIPFQVRPDGHPVVLCSALEQKPGRKGPRLDQANVPA